MEKIFTPKQVAEALGVSESSIKRWVDRGTMQATRTVGGHRKLPLSAVVQFARKQGHAIAQPELLGLAAEHSKCPLELAEAREQLLECVLRGDEACCRALVEPFYLQGHDFVELADDLIAPVFHQVGELWESGDVTILQERRGCEVVVATLHHLRRLLPPLAHDSPTAVAATPSGDHAELPIRLAELVLREKGWNAIILGISLPVEEIRSAVESRVPKVSLLSATHLDDPEAFVEQVNRQLLEPTEAITKWVIGGQAFPCVLKSHLKCERFSHSMADLVEYVSTLQAAPSA